MSYLKTVTYKCGHQRTFVLRSKLLAEGTQYRDLKCSPCRVKEEQLYAVDRREYPYGGNVPLVYTETGTAAELHIEDHDRYDEESGPNDTFDDGWKGSTPVNND